MPMHIDLDRGARLVDSLYQPCRTTVGECLARWRALEPEARAGCYLVVDGPDSTTQQTFNGRQIADLSAG